MQLSEAKEGQEQMETESKAEQEDDQRGVHRGDKGGGIGRG